MAHDRIEVRPEIMTGKAVIKGTRITVELILRACAEGLTGEEIVRHYPQISEDDVRAALSYAADQMGKGRAFAAE
jgi:uncharacterized protein (DUF433 family)